MDRCILRAKEQSTVPLPVQDLMDDHKGRHAHADPFMCRFPCDLIGHEEQQKNGHNRIHDSFDAAVFDISVFNISVFAAAVFEITG